MIADKRFQKRVEDFSCGHCAVFVHGDGYTNHCPNCLWSKHVDINPGDRKAHCGGMMEPIRIVGSSPDYSVVHRCTICGAERVNKIGKKDNIKAILALVQKTAHSS